MPTPATTGIHDLTALRAQILSQSSPFLFLLFSRTPNNLQDNSDILYKTRPNKSIIITGRTLLTAHLLGSSDPADVLVSGNPCSDVAEAYASLLRETAFRLNEVVIRAQKGKGVGVGKK